MDEMGRDEYKALRATIRERGTVRAITFFVTLVAWAALGLVLLVSAHPVIAPLLPLMVLVGGFEAVFQLHVGVERVGRYLQVAYEERYGHPDSVRLSGDAAAPGREFQIRPHPAWETSAMAYGQAHPSASGDALFARIFLLATLVNVLPVLMAAGRGERPGIFVLLILAHAAFGVRIGMAKRRVGRQRAEDLARFRDLLAGK